MSLKKFRNAISQLLQLFASKINGNLYRTNPETNYMSIVNLAKNPER